MEDLVNEEVYLRLRLVLGSEELTSLIYGSKLEKLVLFDFVLESLFVILHDLLPLSLSHLELLLWLFFFRSLWFSFHLFVNQIHAIIHLPLEIRIQLLQRFDHFFLAVWNPSSLAGLPNLLLSLVILFDIAETIILFLGLSFFVSLVFEILLWRHFVI